MRIYLQFAFCVHRRAIERGERTKAAKRAFEHHWLCILGFEHFQDDDKDIVIARQAAEISRLTATLEQTTAEKELADEKTKLAEDECRRLQALLDAANQPLNQPRKRLLSVNASEHSSKRARL